MLCFIPLLFSHSSLKKIMMEDVPISVRSMQIEMSGSQNHAKYVSVTQDLFSVIP